MSRTSKKIVSTTVEQLNELIDSDPRAETLLGFSADGLTTLDVINGLLSEIAEGATIVAARETDGSLVGFVPKRQKTVKEEPVADAGSAIAGGAL